MALTTWPTSLPAPLAAPFERAESRALYAGPGPAAAAARSREVHGTVTVTWQMTLAQAAAFEAWHRVDLSRGGAWFRMPSALPQGWATGSFRFAGALRWEPLTPSLRRLTAPLEYSATFGA